MNGRREDDRRWGDRDWEVERPRPRDAWAQDPDWEARGHERRGGPDRDAGRERRGDFDWEARGPERRGGLDRGTGAERRGGPHRGHPRRGGWASEEDAFPRTFDSERHFRDAARDRDTRDYQQDVDFGRAARAMDRAREYGRDFHLDQELDRRARELDPERIARRPGYSPSGTFREVEEDWRLEPTFLGVLEDEGPGPGRPERPGRHEPPERRRHGPGGRPPGHHRGADEGHERRHRGGGGMDRGRPWRAAGRMAETDVRYGGTQPAGHGPGVENMAPPWDGYGTSPSRPDDHGMGHGGYAGGRARPEGPMRGPPRGRAPRGYQRSSERILTDLCDRLMQSWVDAEDVDIRVRDGVVLLAGVVRSHDERHATEALARDVLGVKEVINDIRVYRDEGVVDRPTLRRPVQVPGVEAPDDDTLHS
ncbi:BON domain-containing protein [Corallococcus macrosporus]|uniref:Phospholipid-binding protein n=1 Tax=Myxococcus fulvus (strain ATCC BAA-855 / HW-1) TaxID=483219 RepID=F8CN43_MYXFH|nr:BON domain-containing protein [Corallococcus macrosporus]AEI67849.1 phospholipid-binding protein [Corallococcus macrosporus]